MIYVNYISGKMTPNTDFFGISRYQSEIHKRLKEKVYLNWIYLNRPTFGFLDYYFTYPLIIKLKLNKEKVTHLPNPWYSHILNLIKLEKTIITLYDLEPSIILGKYKNALHWSFCLKGIKKANKIITLSEFAKREIIQFLGYEYPQENIEVVHEGVDMNKFRKLSDDILLKFRKKMNLDENVRVLLFVGSEQPRKNFKTVLYSLYKLKKACNQSLKLIKVGNPESRIYREKSLNIIKDLGLEKEVVFIPYVSDEDLVLYYNISDCLILPTLYEGGFALPILEAFACKVPVITSKIEPLLELTEGKGAIFVDPTNVDQIKNVVLDLLSGRIDVKKITSEGFLIAKRYNWDKSAEKFYKIYNELNN
ncbi:MAG: glycosyltransferase family 1 protein [Nitrososphaerota archaeon]